jgi:hypothetical protein
MYVPAAGSGQTFNLIGRLSHTVRLRRLAAGGLPTDRYLAVWFRHCEKLPRNMALGPNIAFRDANALRRPWAIARKAEPIINGFMMKLEPRLRVPLALGKGPCTS